MRVLLVPMSLTVPMFAMLVSLARADREMQWADSARSSSSFAHLCCDLSHFPGPGKASAW